MANILTLEDLPESYELIKRAIDSSHNVTWASSISEAKSIFNDDYDLLIADVMLPDGDGFEFCSWVRAHPTNGDIPILFVSAKNNVESCVTGLMAGGDDYIYKPFHLAELRVRVESKLRMAMARKNKNLFLESDGIRMDLRSRKVRVLEDGKEVELDLTPIEFKILQLFLEEPGKACDRDEILNRVWGKSVYIYPRSVDTHVSKLRKKLGSKAKLIRSVHGTGYRFGDHDSSNSRRTGTPGHAPAAAGEALVSLRTS